MLARVSNPREQVRIFIVLRRALHLKAAHAKGSGRHRNGMIGNMNMLLLVQSTEGLLSGC